MESNIATNEYTLNIADERRRGHATPYANPSFCYVNHMQISDKTFKERRRPTKKNPHTHHIAKRTNYFR